MAQIYSIASGKGGVGKSFITANLGVLLANQGHRVLLVDLDLGGPNLHTFFGLANPESGLNSFLGRQVKDLNQVALESRVPNLFIISSMDCSMEIANLEHAQKLKIERAIKGLPYDQILLDLGAGTHFNTLDFFITSNDNLLVLTPEPTSVENAFRFIRTSYLRMIKRSLGRTVFNSILKEVVRRSGNGVAKLADMMAFLVKWDPRTGHALERRLAEFRFNFVLNQFSTELNASFGRRIEKTCNRHFYSTFRFLGNISYDQRVHTAIFSRKMFINEYPYTATATDLQNITDKLTENEQDYSLQSSGTP
jgi:flagellar biosynthesis protein FlhG